MKPVLKNRRGLSAVVTTAIMLTAVAVIGSGVIAWSDSNLRTYQTLITTTSSNLTNKINENLNIENVVFCYTACNSAYTPKVINVTLTNLGNEGLRIAQISASTTSYYTWTLSPQVSLKPQQTYTFQQHFHWNSTQLYPLTVTTARGTILTTQVSAP